MLKFNQRANDLYKEQRSAQLLFIEQKCLDSRGISNESFSVVGNARINVNATNMTLTSSMRSVLLHWESFPKMLVESDEVDISKLQVIVSWFGFALSDVNWLVLASWARIFFISMVSLKQIGANVLLKPNKMWTKCL